MRTKFPMRGRLCGVARVPRRGLAHRSKEKPKLKLLLTEDVEHVGLRGEVVEVRRGFGRNALLNRRQAVYMTPENLARMNIDVAQQQARQAEISRMREEERTRRMLASIRIVLRRRRNRKPDAAGDLFVPITAEIVAHRLDVEKNLRVEPGQVKLTRPIARFGVHKVEVEMAGVTSSVTLDVEELPADHVPYHGRMPWKMVEALAEARAAREQQ